MDEKRSGPAGARERRPRLRGMRPVNWALLAAGAVAVFVGYVLLDRGSVTAAPLLLFVGYLVLIPAGLLAGLGRSGEEAAPGPRGE